MQKKYYNPLMETVELIVPEDPQKEILQQNAMSFIEGMKEVRFDGPRGNKFDFDTFLFLTHNEKTREDKIEFKSWAVDSSRSNPDYMKVLLNLLELPKGRNHPPYPQKRLQYYDEIMPKEDKDFPAIAFATGAKGRSCLFRLKGLSTKESFERLKKAAVDL
jgi:hypothetical protein